MGTHPIFESDFDCLTEMKKRYPTWEVSPFEAEHCYALHSSLAECSEKRDEKEQICMDTKILLKGEIKPESDDELDVDGIETPPKPCYNPTKVKQSFEEIERHARRICHGNEISPSQLEPSEADAIKLADLVERVRTKLQEQSDSRKMERTGERLKLFDPTFDMLNELYLVTRTIKDARYEALKRRIAVDKSATKLRRLFSAVGYKSPNIQWLHEQLTMVLPWYMLALYLDVICSLRSKIPNLMNQSLEPLLSKGDSRVARALAYTTRKPWDPITASHMNVLKNRLGQSSAGLMGKAHQPIICYVPTRSIMPRQAPQLKRLRFWNAQLSSFGKIQNISYQHIPAEGELGDNVEKMVNATRIQVQEMHKRNPLKPIILIGWDSAALISLLVSVQEPKCITAVCCLGLPLISLRGQLAELPEPKCPLFVAMGSEAANTDVKWFEEERDQFKVESALVVVEGGDSLLRVKSETQLEIGLTQSMIDKHVIDEMWEFLYKIISGKQQITKDHHHHVQLGHVLGADHSDEHQPVTKPKPVMTPTQNAMSMPNIKDYKAFLREKCKTLGRVPNPAENKKFFAEFTKVIKQKSSVQSGSSKRRPSDQQSAEPSVKKVKTESPQKQHSEQMKKDEIASATRSLEQLLDE